jgi:hypothetical protein
MTYQIHFYGPVTREQICLACDGRLFHHDLHGATLCNTPQAARAMLRKYATRLIANGWRAI